MTKLEDIPIEDILAAVGDEHYQRAQAQELERLEAMRASLAVQYENVSETPVLTEAERAPALEELKRQLRSAHWAIERIKARQETAAKALRGN